MIETAAASFVAHRRTLLPETDERLLQQLILAYGLCSDFAMVDDLVELFTPAAVWDGRSFRFPRCEGREEIRTHFQSACPPGLVQVHQMGPPALSPGSSPASAVGVVPFNAMQSGGEGSVVAGAQAHGLYEDRYERTGGTWRIAERRLHLRLVRR